MQGLNFLTYFSQDSSIASSQAILDVIDVLVPDSIDYSVVLSDPSDYEDKLQNAK